MLHGASYLDGLFERTYGALVITVINFGFYTRGIFGLAELAISFSRMTMFHGVSYFKW
jgi:hypothetical protein